MDLRVAIKWSKASPIAMKDPNFTHRFSITDIQHDFVRLNLKNEISNGLKLQPKELPSLLLWDNKGLALFEKVRASASIEYYPSKKETEVITQYAQEIAQQIQKNAVVIELGSGYVYGLRSHISSTA